MTTASVSDSLAEVERVFSDLETRHQTEILGMDQELKNLETAIVNLQEQLDALRKSRAELGAKVRSFATERVTKAYGSVYEALRAQKALLTNREVVVSSVVEARKATLEGRLREGANGALVDEFVQFRTTVAPTLSALPESYRGVILKHHQSVSDKLKDRVAMVLGAPLEVAGDALSIEIVYAIDAPEGDPELLVVVLPVPEEIYANWSDQPDGLGLWIACRVVQAIYETAAAAAFPKAEVTAGGHEGLLVVEVDLTGGGTALVDLFEQQLATVLGGAPEFGGAGITVTARRVPIDYVLPPEGGDVEASVEPRTAAEVANA